MNTPDDRLNRLLEAAQKACPPIPAIPAWLEHGVVVSLRAEPSPSFGFFDSRFVFRLLAGAAVVTAASVVLPLIQVKNPYIETMELANTTPQMEKIP
jgi:hypothetical protein